MAGYVNCDVVTRIKADKHFDLDVVPYPFEPGCADEILLDNVLEHLDNIPQVMGELHRILRVGGVLRIYVPYGKSDVALQDPTHRHYFTEKSLDYFTGGDACDFYSPARFRAGRAELYCVRTNFGHTLRNCLPFKQVLRYFLYNIYDGIYFELEKAEWVAPGASEA